MSKQASVAGLIPKTLLCPKPQVAVITRQFFIVFLFAEGHLNVFWSLTYSLD